MVDVAELVVRAVPEGVDDVEGEVDGMTESVEEAGEEMEDTADGFAGLQQRFKGAGAALAGAVAMTAGVLLGRIPVLSETMGAFGAVFDSMGLRVDGLIRGPLTSFNNFLFDLSETFHEADGALGALMTTISAIGPAVAGAVAAYSAWLVQTGGLVALKGALISAGQALIGALVTLAGVISLPVLAVAALIAALGLLVWYFQDEIGDGVNTAVDYLGNFTEWFTNAVSDASDWGTDLIGGWVDGIQNTSLQGAVDFVTGLADTFSDMISDAWDWGRDLIQRLIAGIKSRAGALRQSIGGMEVAAGVSVDDITGAIGGFGESASEAGSDFIGRVGGGGMSINLDGRSVDDNQGRYRADNLHRRGG